MVDKYPLYNDYWDDKKPKLRNIQVPLYATASYSTGLHTEGSVKGFLLAGSHQQWCVQGITLMLSSKPKAKSTTGCVGPPHRSGMTYTNRRTSTICKDSLTTTCWDETTGERKHFVFVFLSSATTGRLLSTDPPKPTRHPSLPIESFTSNVRARPCRPAYRLRAVARSTMQQPTGVRSTLALASTSSSNDTQSSADSLP